MFWIVRLDLSKASLIPRCAAYDGSTSFETLLILITKSISQEATFNDMKTTFEWVLHANIKMAMQIL